MLWVSSGYYLDQRDSCPFPNLCAQRTLITSEFSIFDSNSVYILVIRPNPFVNPFSSEGREEMPHD